MLDLREASRQHMPIVPNIPALKDAAIATWKARMVNEYGSSRVFEGLYTQLSPLGLATADLERLRSFAEDERRHGILCGSVVEALGGEAIAPALPVIPFPEHHDVSPLEAAIRNLLSISCLSETIAVSLIGAERLEMPEGPLRELLTNIYADECAHANFGWRLLGDLLAKGDSEIKERLKPYLQLAFAHLETHELAHLPIGAQPPKEGTQLGLCSGLDARTLFYATIEQIIIPGLTQHGLDAQWAWDTRSEANFVQPTA
jgi:hypothetical protein